MSVRSGYLVRRQVRVVEVSSPIGTTACSLCGTDGSPAKSSLLQVFVSISGLVLVRSPYHCEPAFAKLEGTKEGKVNS